MTRVVAGIDAGKAKLDVHLGGEDRTLPNDRDGFRAIAKWFGAAKVERVVLGVVYQIGLTRSVPDFPGCSDAGLSGVRMNPGHMGSLPSK